MSIVDVSPDTLRQWLDSGEAEAYDVRGVEEFARRHIAGARPMPPTSLDPRAVVGPPRAVLYCRTGRRSREAGHRLLAAGAEEVLHLAGGLRGWSKAGFPVVEDRSVPISLQRQVQIVAGSLMLGGTLAGAFVSPWWLLLAGGVGAGLLFAGLSDTCAMARLLQTMPWNRIER